jgi:hypothetical protein
MLITNRQYMVMNYLKFKKKISLCLVLKSGLLFVLLTRTEHTNRTFYVVALQCVDATAGGTCQDAKAFNC